MTADEVIQRAYLLAKGKATPPTAGTNKYNALLALCDLKQKEWSREPSVEWNSLYSLVTLASSPIGTDQTYALDDTIDYISKREGDYIIATNGINSQTYRLVQPDQLYGYRDDYVLAQVGRSLKFPQAPTATSTVFGYDIQVPAILAPNDITAGTDEVQVDDPIWLVYAVAADYVRNDLVKQAQQPYLSNMANELMEKMKQANGGSYETIATPWGVTGETWI